MRTTDTRLDALARGLASGMSRRDVLRAGGAAFIGAAAMTPVDAWAAVTGHCPSHRVKCHGTCCPKGEVCLAPKHKGGKHRCGCPSHETRCSGSWRGHDPRPEPLRRLRRQVRSRSELRERRVRLSLRRGNVFRRLRLPAEQSGALRCLWQRMPLRTGVRGRPLRHAVPDRADGVRRRLRKPGEQPPELRIVRNGLRVRRCVRARDLHLTVSLRPDQLRRRLRDPVERSRPLWVVHHGMPGRGDVQQRDLRVPGRDDGVRRSVREHRDRREPLRPTCVNCTNLPFVDAAHCANGTCVIDQCQYNWLDCNGDPLDGCEHLGLTC